MNKRARMNYSNRKVVQWLQTKGYDHIWLKPHRDPRKKYNHELVYRTNGMFYTQLDIWNLFDGICFDKEGRVWFFQNSTTNYHPEQPFIIFARDKQINILLFKVIKRGREWEVKNKTIKVLPELSPQQS
jgi:hypothetical protein